MDIEAHEFFCLLGPSGCGKTTVLRLLASPARLERSLVGPDPETIATGVDPVFSAYYVAQEEGLFKRRDVGSG